MLNVTRKNRTSGFSLVEICIVLVIMGLIVGGVLAGATLKRGLQVKAVIDQEIRLNQGMAKFKLIYGGWPGDLWNATDKFGAADANGTTVTNGNGDGLIVGGEAHRILHHLSMAGLVEGGYNGGWIWGFNVDWNAGNLIYGPIDKKSIFLIESSVGSPLMIQFFGIQDEDDNGIVDWNGGLGYFRGVFTPQEMQNVDTKYDNGLPDTGNIRAYNGSNVVTGCAAAGAYVMATTTKDCYFGVIVETMF